ncbi:MAG: cyclopropane-fatty-acyl-phospholipid synthase family protein [Planctomycetota bacterium]
MYKFVYSVMEKDQLPDFLIRAGIRKLLKQRLQEERISNDEQQRQLWMDRINILEKSPIALQEESANEQHYEVPAEFYQYCLGNRFKYSCGYWPTPETTLDQSEEIMLDLYCQRAQIEDGQRILDLGCGWGSLSLYLAERYPKAQITGLSNSQGQREFILKQAAEKKLSNLEIVTGNIKTFEFEKTFDRILSIEMFEHMRNYQKLLHKIASWLSPTGLLFIHIFCHREFLYLFEVRDESDWMSKYFFSGGLMPSEDLLLFYQAPFHLKAHWRVNGTHYQKTSEAWLTKLDQHRKTVLEIFSKVYSSQEALKRFVYWRVFFMACAELFGYHQGKEWFVSHYLFGKKTVLETK